VKVVCDYCGKSFRRNSSKVREAKKHFCCKKCYLNYRKDYRYGYARVVYDKE